MSGIWLLLHSLCAFCIKVLCGTVFLIPLPPAFWTACSRRHSNIAYNFCTSVSRYRYAEYLNHFGCSSCGCRVAKSAVFARYWATFKLLWRVDFLPWFKGLTFCLNSIWLKCFYWNILYSTYDKTVLDVKFCEGWPLVGSILALFMMICIMVTIKYIFYIWKYHFDIWDMGIALLWGLF